MTLLRSATRQQRWSRAVIVVLVVFAVISVGSGAARRLSASHNGVSVVMTGAPSGQTASTGATLSWVVSGTSKVWCSLDHGTAGPCVSPKTYSGLKVGSHSFVVSAWNRAGVQSASAAWAVVPPAPAAPPPAAQAPAPTPTTASAAAPAPTIAFASTPTSPTTSTNATFSWTSQNDASVACSLDGATAATCTSPDTLTGLTPGAHTFRATATGAGGSAVASYTWTISPSAAPPPSAPSSSSVAPPLPPTGYALPTGATLVSSSSELIAALAGATKDIVLADGTYDNATAFTDSNGSRLYAQHVGKAVLTAGLVIGGNFSSGGGVAQGLTFDVSSTSKVFGGGVIHVWGNGGTNTSVLDCVFRGHSVIPVGLLAYNPQGLDVERSQFYSFTDEGIRASDNTLVSYGASTPRMSRITDVLVDGVSRSTPGASDGTAEAGIWIGHPVTNGVSRIKIRNVAWSGIEIANNAWDTAITDVDIDMSGPSAASGVAVYLEHFSRHLTFNRFSISGSRIGFNGEWADPAWGGVAAAHNVTIENGTIDAAGWSKAGHTAGVYLDEGSDSTTVTGVVFKNQNWAAIGAYLNVGTNTFGGNGTSGLASGAVSVSTQHI